MPHFDLRRSAKLPVVEKKSTRGNHNKKPSGCLGLKSPKTKQTDVELFYSWECVSFIRKDGSTFDIVVKDMHELLCLIHVVHRHVYNINDEEEIDEDE